MAFVQLLLQLFVATGAFHLHLNEVENVRAARLPDLGNIVSSVTDAVGNATDAVGDVISKVGNASSKVESMTDQINSAIAGKLNSNAHSGPLGDIIGTVASAAASAVDNVTSIFDGDKGRSAIFLNMTAAEAAAQEAAKIAITIEEDSRHYKDLKASAQSARNETLKHARLIADKTDAAIGASAEAFKTIADKVNGRPTNLTVEASTLAAEEATGVAEKAAERARATAALYKAKREEAKAALNATLAAALHMKAMINETLEDSRVAAGILKAKLEELSTLKSHREAREARARLPPLNLTKKA